MAVHFQQIIEGMLGPALLAVFGACAKYLRDISRDVADLKTSLIVTRDRLDGHSQRLIDHDVRIRDLESTQQRGYVS